MVNHLHHAKLVRQIRVQHHVHIERPAMVIGVSGIVFQRERAVADDAGLVQIPVPLAPAAIDHTIDHPLQTSLDHGDVAALSG